MLPIRPSSEPSPSRGPGRSWCINGDADVAGVVHRYGGARRHQHRGVVLLDDHRSSARGAVELRAGHAGRLHPAMRPTEVRPPVSLDAGASRASLVAGSGQIGRREVVFGEAPRAQPHIDDLDSLPFLGAVAVAALVLALERLVEPREGGGRYRPVGDRNGDLGGLARIAQVNQSLDLDLRARETLRAKGFPRLLVELTTLWMPNAASSSESSSGSAITSLRGGSRQIGIDLEGTAHEVLRIQISQRHVCVGHRRLGAAASVARRTRLRPRALRSHPQRSTAVDPGNADPAGTDLGQVDCRHPRQVAAPRSKRWPMLRSPPTSYSLVRR